MKRIASVLMFMVCLLSAHARVEVDSLHHATKRKLFSIGFCYEYKYCYRTSKEQKSYFGHYSDDELYSAVSYNSYNEIPKFGYTAGIRFSFAPIKYLSINFGVMYSTLGYKTKTIDSLSTVYVGEFNNGIPPYTTYNNSPIDFKYSYISIPLTIDFVQHLNKFELHVGAGANFNLLREATANNENIEPNYPPGRYKRVRNANLIYYNLHIGCYYNLWKRIRIGIIPTFNYQKEPLHENSVHLYTIGTEIEFSIKF